MIPVHQLSGKPKSWQQCLREAITDPAELLDILDLDPALLPGAHQAAALFPLRIPRGFVARMQKGQPDDPLLRQVLPVAVELDETPGYIDDAVGDLSAALLPGVLQKYSGRALLITTGACGVHCRFCFRRHFPYGQESLGRSRWQESIEQLRRDHTLHEILLSGGDPLSLDNDRLDELIGELAAIPHVKTLRIHTRQPIVLPERVDEGLLSILGKVHLNVVVVVHANHGNEIDDSVSAALRQIRDTGATLLNQSVLLRGVNDSVTTLANLSHRLLAAGGLPYYLHLPDRVRGTAHFAVSESRAKTLLNGLRRTLPGYLVPRLVKEQAGEPFKLPIT